LDLTGFFGDVGPTDEDLRRRGRKPEDYDYVGSSRSGYVVEPGIENCGEVIEALRLKELLTSKFWRNRFFQAEEYEWQPTLFQPVGGMDQIWRHGFLKRGNMARFVHTGHEVVSVQNTTEGGAAKVRVTFRPSGGLSQVVASLDADYCISTIPLP